MIKQIKQNPDNTNEIIISQLLLPYKLITPELLYEYLILHDNPYLDITLYTTAPFTGEDHLCKFKIELDADRSFLSLLKKGNITL
jgi:hypothetical protein